jgi:hypothetical protein
MPTRIGKRTIAEIQENRRRLLALRETGLDVGSNDAFLPRRPLRERLRLEPVDVESASIFDLPACNGYIFVAWAKLIVLASRPLILDYEMTAPWDDFPLDLEGPEYFSSYRDIVADFYPEPLTILNRWLMGKHCLHRCQREGLIIARGLQPVPRERAEHSWLDIELSLWDENDEELRFEFRGRLNHRLKILHERQLRRQYPYRQPREPFFGRDGALRNDERPVSQTTGSPPQPSQRQTDMIKKIWKI